MRSSSLSSVSASGMASILYWQDMTQWLEIARALDPPVPEAAAQALVVGLDRLETTLAAHIAQLPVDTLPWNGAIEAK